MPELIVLPGLVCGVDEAGRGPLAGPVVAAAVILDPAYRIAGLNDSKKLSAVRRAELAVMQRAVAGLAIRPERVLVDGNRCPRLDIPVEAVVRGDGKIAAIAAASVLAKTVRDAGMRALHEHYPQYGFDRHMGYPTEAHCAALVAHGASPAHRRSFGPVARQLSLI
jgi:ribonuclease HII